MTGPKTSRITEYLKTGSPFLVNIYFIAAAFCTYFCMYAFRKPFSVGNYPYAFALPLVGEIDAKILFVVSQVIGYMLSKFLGIKVVSEASPAKRAWVLFWMIALAEVALLGFGFAPNHWKVLFIFLNGIPLGMVWGLTFSFLEGRRSTELLGAGLSTSYIVASGAVKTSGSWVLGLGIPDEWMPFVTGLMFLPFFILALWLLQKVPPPSEEDRRLRTERKPMDAKARKEFFQKFAPGLICLTLFFMLLTGYRDFRDNFAREIWEAVGAQGDIAVFTTAEIPISLLVLAVLASLMFIRDNKKAVAAIHGLLIGGSLLIGIATLAFQQGLIGPYLWMVSVGLGLYLGYVPFGCVLFDRIIAETTFVGTAAFMIYVTDAFGYLGSVVLLLYKNFGQPQMSWYEFFIGFSYLTSILCAIGFSASMFYFLRRHYLSRTLSPNPK